MNNLANEKYYEKYAWIIFLVIGLLILVGGIPHSLGYNTDPELVQAISGKPIDELKVLNPMFFNLYNFYFRGGGLSDVGFAFFIIFISLTAYRWKQKWAWYAFCFVPIWFLAWILLSSTIPAEAQSTMLLPLIVIIVLSLVGLLLPFRTFFPKKTSKDFGNVAK